MCILRVYVVYVEQKQRKRTATAVILMSPTVSNGATKYVKDKAEDSATDTGGLDLTHLPPPRLFTIHTFAADNTNTLHPARESHRQEPTSTPTAVPTSCMYLSDEAL